MPTQAPSSAPVAPLQAQETPSSPATEQHLGELLSQDHYTTTKAMSAKDGETCPDCDSVNYMRSAQAPNSMKQCFNCGYNPRFLHTTHGASGIGQNNLPVKTARSQTMNTNNFNPGQPGHVIGRVG